MRAEPSYFLSAREFAQIERLLARLARQPQAASDRAFATTTEKAAGLFRRWSGVPLRRFVEAVREQSSVFAAAHALALRGTGRLHDRTLAFGRGGSRELVWGRARSPFGECVIAESTGGIVALDFFELTAARQRAWLAGLTAGQVRRDDRHASAMTRRVFVQSGRVDLHLLGTPFQWQVWRALAAADSFGSLTYSDLARDIGRPGAARAVGNAVGRNPILWLIPCHHVLRADGALGGFRAGVARKRAMLVWESLAMAS